MYGTRMRGTGERVRVNARVDGGESRDIFAEWAEKRVDVQCVLVVN